MIAENDVLGAPVGTDRPAAFEPDLARSLNLPERTPGWDVGPERRIDDGRGLLRALTGVGAATVAALAIMALKRRARSS